MGRHRRRSVPICAVICSLTLAVGCAGSTSRPRSSTATPASATSTPTTSRTPSESTPTGGRISFEPAAASFVSPAQGWMLGRAGCPSCAALRMTKDGGAHWTTLPAPPAALGYYVTQGSHTRAVTDITFATSADGYLFGPALLLTHNGGRSWTRTNLPGVYALAVGSDYAYAVTPTASGTAAMWRNRVGTTGWDRLPLPTQATTPARTANNHGELQVAAEADTVVIMRTGFHGPALTNNQVGELWASSDDGIEWSQRPAPCRPSDGGAAVIAIVRAHPDDWLLDCFDNEQSSQEQNTQHHLYDTTTAGSSWTRLPDPSRHNEPALLADNGAGHAFLATEGIGDTMVGTLDSGQHWQTMIRSGGSFYGWADLHFVDARTGFVVGPTHYATEHLYRTDDGGKTWRKIPA